MNIINIGSLVALIVLIVLGIAIGFGRSLKIFTKGVVGIIISVFVCATFGGMVLGIPAVAKGVTAIHEYFASVAEFLGKMRLEIIVFYIIMFVVVQILRVLIVKFICSIFSVDKKPMKIVNRTLGAIFVPAVVLCFVLLVFGVMKLLGNTAGVQEFLMKIDGTVLHKLYLNNPINLSGLI